jgi:hypothetical protein
VTRWNISNVARTVKTLPASIDEVLFRPQNGAADQQIARSVWLSVIPIILVTMVINGAAFLFLTGPQTLLQMERDETPLTQRVNLDAQLFDVLANEEKGLTARQRKRAEELEALSNRAYDAPDSPQSQVLCRDIASLSRSSEIEVAKDTGIVDAFEEVGFDWAQRWARGQDRAESTEMETWGAAQDFAEACLRFGKSSRQGRDANQRLVRKTLTFLASIEQMEAYTENMKLIASSETVQLKEEYDAINSQVQTVVSVMRLSGDALLCAVLLSLSFGLLWFTRRLAGVLERRQKELDKLTI